MRVIFAATLAAALALLAGRAAAGEPLETGLSNLASAQPGRSMRASSSHEDLAGNADARPIRPGQALVLADLQGPGVIRHFWNTISCPQRGYSRLLVLRIYWDGEEAPSVECPIGDFFGVGHGLDLDLNSLPVRVTAEGRARNCYWPMPFRKSARITVTNEGREAVRSMYWYVDWQQLPDLPADTLYFHAAYRQEHPVVMGRNYLIAQIEGRGHYVGTVLNVRQHMGGWWGEGDDFFYIDGEKTPSLRGTGSEDYLCDAWGVRAQGGAFYGAAQVENGQILGRTTCYLWHVMDPVVFTKSLRVEIEHKGTVYDENMRMTAGYGERKDDYSSVALWYQAEPHKPFEPMPKGYERLYYDPREAAVFEGEDLPETAKVTGGRLQVQEIKNAAGGKQLFWIAPEAGQTLTLKVQVAKAGRYLPVLVLTRSHDYGVFEVRMDGEPIPRSIDLYSPKLTFVERYLPETDLAAGEHTITLVNRGRIGASSGHLCGVDQVILAPMKEAR